MPDTILEIKKDKTKGTSPDVSCADQRRGRLFFLFVWCLLACLVYPAFPAVASAPSGVKTMVIGTKEAPPFSFKDEKGQWKGISIQLWKQMAQELGLEYVFKEYDLQGLMAAVEDKSIDAAVAALTITAEREKRFDFSHPFHTSGLGIAVLQENKNSWTAVFERFFSLDFLRVVLALALVLLGVGLLAWFFERKKNPEEFGSSTLAGVGSGFWWSAVTMTTVGYGDKAPKTFGGRVLGIVWMFLGIIIISSFTAAMTSTLTVSKISSKVNSPQDLHRVRVGSLEHSTSAVYLNNNQIHFAGYPSVKMAMEGLLAQDIDAVVYDSPILRYLAVGEFQGRVQVLKTSFGKQQYGIALPAGSPLREQINRLIPKITTQEEWQGLLFRYLGSPGS